MSDKPLRIAVVTPMMATGETGGAEALYIGLVTNLRLTGHTVDQVEVVIDESTFDAILGSYMACYDLDLSAYDLVISTKAPTYMVRHPNHVSYLLHTIRAFYDMFHREFGAGTPEQFKQRALIHTLDQWGLSRDRNRAHFTNGHETFQRLYDADPTWRHVNFRALHHPPALEGFHEPRRGEYIFLPGRLHRWKRADLIIEAYRHLDRDIPLKISGTGEDAASLRALAAGDPRIEFLGRVDDAQLLSLYAGAIAVPFVPVHEDYGLITVEAFKSKKPVITCTDSGEPLHFVRNYETGFVVPPEPLAIADRLAYLIDHPAEAALMGRNGFDTVKHITWERVVPALTGDSDWHEYAKPWYSLSTPAVATPEPAQETAYTVSVLDMQPIDPPVGGGRLRLLGLYHGLGPDLPTTYCGTYDWPGEPYRRHKLSETLTEIDVPLSEAHFAAHAEWQERAGGKNVIDVAFSALAHHSEAYLDAAREQAATADIVVFSHPWVYPLVRDELRQRPQVVVYDSHNVEGLLRAALLDDGAFGTEIVRQVIKTEHDLCHDADLVLACSHEDREIFHQIYSVPYEKIAVVANGTFVTKILRASAADKRDAKARLNIADCPLAIFLGSEYAPNIEAAKFICETIAPALPDVMFAICGGVGDALRAATIDRANVLITGKLDSDELRAYLAAADVAVNPMFSGSGTNIKMFDFMAAGLPVVTTAVGARGIAQGGSPAFIVADERQFIASIEQVLHDPACAGELSVAARHLVESQYAWERISANLGALLHRSRAKLGVARPFFSMLVPTYERHERLTDLMAALREQTRGDFEIIVVDQSAEPWEGRTQYPDLDLLYIHTDVKGAISARNTAAFHARGTVLAFTDDDCLPLPDWLENARRYFDEPSVVGVEGLIESEHRTDPNYRAVTNLGFEGTGYMTANLFVRRELFNAINGFDLQFDHPHFREDTDLGWRACEHGAFPFAHDVRVYHPPHRRIDEREGHTERDRFFEKDALLLRKHPERYKALFLNEGHYRHTTGFGEHFLRGAEKYAVAVDDFYLALLGADAAGISTERDTAGCMEADMRPVFSDSRALLARRFISLLHDYRPLQAGAEMEPADAFFAYRLLLGRNPDTNDELPRLLSSRQTFREFMATTLSSDEFRQSAGFFPARRHFMAGVEGLRFWFDASDREMGVEMAMGTYEPATVVLMKSLLKPGMRCLDIGAHAGFFTCLMASLVGEAGQVYAFEPMPESFELLEKNIVENRFSNIVRAYRQAASNLPGSGTASIVSRMYVLGSIPNMPTAPVERICLDDVIPEKIDFVKIDVEGHEPAVLQGMRALLARDMPIVVSSANEYWLRECGGSSIRAYIDLLTSLGYEIYNAADMERPINTGNLNATNLTVMVILALPSKTTTAHSDICTDDDTNSLASGDRLAGPSGSRGLLRRNS